MLDQISPSTWGIIYLVIGAILLLHGLGLINGNSIVGVIIIIIAIILLSNGYYLFNKPTL